MKLTKYEKEAIYRAIRNDIPKPSNKVKELQEIIVKQMSVPVRNLYKKNPDALRRASFGTYEYYTERYAEIIVGDVDYKVALKPLHDEITKYNDTCKKLEIAVNACNTLAALKKLLPEFISYFPTEDQPTKNLPAVANLVADMTKLGWPKKGAAKC